MADSVLAEYARAKVNLTLALRGRRADGYHLLSSLVVFPNVGDRVSAAPAKGLNFTVSGPFSATLAEDHDNLVPRAARLLARRSGRRPDVALTLEKNLPVAAGIGGGSSDAAACLRALCRLWRTPVPADIAFALGADVPVCLRAPAAQMMGGVGEVLAPAPSLPPFWMVLVHPGVALPTAAVFDAVADRNPPPPPEMPARGFATFDAFRCWLGAQRNDLASAAGSLCPAIPKVLDALGSAPFSAMSGSGATCFAVVSGQEEARRLARSLDRSSGWWVAAAPVGG